MNGICPTISVILAREVYYRRFANRRQVVSYTGLPPATMTAAMDDATVTASVSKTGRLVPDHKTIADFRKDNGPEIVHGHLDLRIQAR